LSAGQVTAPEVASCVTDGNGPRDPDTLVSCPLSAVGRFVTVRSVNRSHFRVNGAELYGGAGNLPPVLSPIGPRTVTEGGPFQLALAAFDTDGPPPIVFSEVNDLPGNPSILTDNGDGTATLAWTGTQGNLGQFTISVTVADADGAQAAETFTLDVVANQPPLITPIDDVTITDNSTLTVDFSATDPDGPAPITFSESGTLPGSPLLTNLGDGTGRLEWTPGEGDLGMYVVTLRASDADNNESSVQFGVEVVANQPPVVTAIGDQHVAEGETLHLTVTASDADGPTPLVLSIDEDLPGSPEFTDHQDGNGSLAYAPGAGAAGTYTVTIEATDAAGASGSSTFSVTVLANLPPVIGHAGTLQAREGEALVQDLGITDTDGPAPLMISATTDLPGNPDVLSGDVFTWTPATGDSLGSPYSMTVTAVDGLGNATVRSFDVYVAENFSPTLSFEGETTVEEWQALELTITAGDTDGTVESVDQSSNLPGAEPVLTEVDGGVWTLLWHADSGTAVGAPYDLTVTATDNDGAATTLDLTVTVTARTPPNIVVILTDDQGYAEVSYAGIASDVQTPAIDGIAADGMRFSNFYANSTVCSPTRASLLTGRYPSLVGVPGTVAREPNTNMGHFAPNGPTLPEILKAQGYHTGLVGKWHLGDRIVDRSNLPTRRGFDHYRGFIGSAGDYYSHDASNYAWPGTGLVMHDETVLAESAHQGTHWTDLFTPWAVDYITERTTNQTQPFYLQLAYTAPHDPVQAPQAYVDAVLAREPGIDPDRAALVALIEHMDDSIATVIQTLKDRGVYDDTLIVFTSDNGGFLRHEANNGPYRGGKLDVYEGGIRVPAAVSWPGRIASGTATDEVAVTMDLYPTIAEILGVHIAHPIDGRSILGTLRQTNPSYPERDLIFENRSTIREHRYEMSYALRRGDWKLANDLPGGVYELYDLASDPQETHDLAGAQPAVFANLMAALEDHITRSAQIPWQRQPAYEHGTVVADHNWSNVPLAREYRGSAAGTGCPGRAARRGRAGSGRR
jgi:arylsulfatase A-like enzyme